MIDRGTGWARWGALLMTAGLLGACDRAKDAPAAGAGVADAAAPDAGEGSGGGPPQDAGAPEPPPRDEGEARAPAGEARRRVARRLDDPLLAPHRDALVDHYGDRPPLPLEVQTAALPDGREAFLFLGPPEAREPLVIALGESGLRAWTKAQPLAGVVPGVRELAILGAPEGGVALAFCDPEGKLAALRHWTAEGGIVADYEIVDADGCAALSAASWPGQGFVVAVAGGEGARAQLLDRNGSRAWGRAGLRLPWRAAPGAPVTIAPHGDAVVLLQAASPDGAKPGAASTLAMRYDTRGNALWRAPVRVGPAPSPPSARVVAAPGPSGALRVELGGRAVDLTTAGL